MNVHRVYNNTIAVLIVIVAWLLMILLGGCMTTYSVERQMADGSFVRVVTKSFRKFEQPKLEYETPDGTIFRFNAESVNTDYSPMEYAGAAALQTLIDRTIPSIPGVPQ